MDQRLSEAARTGDREALLELLREDPLLLDRATTMDDCASDTPLHVSAMVGHVDFVRELLRLKPSLARARDRHGFGPLHLASAAGHAHVVTELLAVDGGSCDLKDRYGRTAVHWAAIKGRVRVLDTLMSVRPDLGLTVTAFGETVMHLAVKGGHYEAVKYLLATRGGRERFLKAKDDDGNTVLHLAVARKQYQVGHWTWSPILFLELCYTQFFLQFQMLHLM
ncbi:hypothetical protein QJS04_geneDACA015644 [Acorus gramineus]|uniref:Uncharacterized protein n=1 Tax=Acorus gramineus TaxID=55184 RepID=A0AAV9ALW5_ACOGR|nr:hypothetical protein QJS04_geneDACA015644 [Acorus gramineus]